MVTKMDWLIRGLVVYPENMKHNMEKVRGMYFSQPVLLALTEAGVSREDAYSQVQRCAMRVWDEDVSLRDSLGADADITARLDAATLDRCFDLDHQLRNIPVIFERTLALKSW
jgi:adenylosuccinate lyase